MKWVFSLIRVMALGGTETLRDSPIEALLPYWEQYRRMLYEMVGDPEKEEEKLRAVSPVFHVDKIVAPLLIAQGANDPRVVKSESDQMVDALCKRGIDVPYIVKDNEGHGFRNEENRFESYGAMEKFLAKHLGGRMEEKQSRKQSEEEQAACQPGGLPSC